MSDIENKTIEPILPDNSSNTDDEDILYEHYRIAVDRGQDLLRIDKYLQLHIANVSRTKIQAAANAGCIQVNGRPVKPNHKVHPQDTITVLLPQPPQHIELVPEPVPFTVVYEDDDVLVIDKPAGIVVHPAVGNTNGTLLNGLLYYFKDKVDANGHPITPYLCHRIDKNTSGLMVVTKNEAAQVALSNQFFHHTIERKYNALVWGDFDADDGTIEGNIGRSHKQRKVMTVYPDGDYGKHAETHWHVVERFGYITWVTCVLETGRTHQIRAHMRYIGHPLFNDEAYGGDRILKGTTFSKYQQFVQNCFALLPRQALHASVLGFEHPTTHEQLHFELPLPPDMTAVIEKWRHYTSHTHTAEEL